MSTSTRSGRQASSANLPNLFRSLGRLFSGAAVEARVNARRQRAVMNRLRRPLASSGSERGEECLASAPEDWADLFECVSAVANELDAALSSDQVELARAHLESAFAQAQAAYRRHVGMLEPGDWLELARELKLARRAIGNDWRLARIKSQLALVALPELSPGSRFRLNEARAACDAEMPLPEFSIPGLGRLA